MEFRAVGRYARESWPRLLGAGLLIVLVSVAFRVLPPEPELIGRFGLPSLPPPGERAAFASFKIGFKSWLRFLVTLDSIAFTENGGNYVLEDTWVIESGDGCVVWADSLDQIPKFPLAQTQGYRIAGKELNILLRLGFPDIVNTTGEERAGPYHVILRLRFVGIPYMRRFQWGPL